MNEIIPYKGRKLNRSLPVYIYKNLHKNCYSVRQQGKVIGHTHAFCLKNCSFHVIQSGRRWTLKNKRKCIHAYVSGILTESVDLNRVSRVYYNPYYRGYFFTKKDGRQFKVHSNEFCIGNANGIFI